MLKKIIKENINIIVILFIILLIIIIVHLLEINIKTQDSIVFQYDSIKNKDIIPFNSIIEGDAYLYSDYTNIDSNKYYYSTNGISTSFLNVNYCQDNKCLESGNYDLIFPLVKLGSNNHFSYYVPSYNNIFNTNNTEYTAWEVYLLPFSYYSYYDDAKTNIRGNYYNILLIPTTNKKNSCLQDNSKINWTKEIPYQVSTTGNWKDEGNKYYYNRNHNSTKSILELTFKAQTGDVILFDLKSNSNTLQIKLNGQIINDEIGVTNELYNIYSKYDTKSIYIKDSGNYKIEFIDDKLSDNYHINYHSYTYVKDFLVLSHVSKESSSKYYINCDNDIKVGNSDDV